MTIYDPTTMKEILTITCSILHKNFYYDEESIHQFIDNFIEKIAEELEYFRRSSENKIIDKLHNDKMARLYFTCFFVSTHLRATFIQDMHFSEQELHAFESILPKYTGEPYHEEQPKCKRAYD